MKRLPRFTLLLTAGVILSEQTEACGPFFPDSYLEQPGLILRPPVSDPGGELQRITAWAANGGLLTERFAPLPRPGEEPGEVAAFPDFEDARKHTLAADLEEVCGALTAAGMPQDKVKSVTDEYLKLRSSLTANLGQAFAQTSFDADGEKVEVKPAAIVPEPTWPAEIPDEFKLYAEGARLVADGKVTEAREQWRNVLNLPEAERKHRSVWAAYMLGRTLEREAPATASRWYQQTRKFALAGCSDSLELARTSYLREAQIATALLDWEAAARLLLAQRESGSRNDDLIWGLASNVMHSGNAEADFKHAAGMPVFQQILTARMLPRRFWDFIEFQENAPSVTRWITTLEQNSPEIKIELADRAAWAAYTHGNFELAKRWLALADRENPYAAWIRAKLQLVEGKPEKAVITLKSAGNSFSRKEWGSENFYDYRDYHGRPDDPATFYKLQFEGDLGMASLGTGKFVSAFEHLLRSGFEWDASYVGERCLSRTELLEFARKHFNDPGNIHDLYQDPRIAGANCNKVGSNVRYLLARRLARDHYFKDARSYYPPSLLPDFDAYVSNWRLGKDQKRSVTSRVDALWKAAQIQRDSGMDLFGTELGPDHAWSGGNFEGLNLIRLRRVSKSQADQASTPDAPPDPESGAYADSINLPDGRKYRASISAAERVMLQKTALRFEKRYQYRFEAAELAWQAAHLLPKNNDQAARILLTAGRWIMYLDPKAADKFYKALIWRNWNLPIAREADAKRWFPPLSSLPPE